MNRNLVWPAGIAVWAAAAIGLMASGQTSELRRLVVFSFMLLCPGLAFVRLLGVRGFLAQLALVIALSVALDAAVAEIMIFAHAWSPLEGLAALVCLSVAGALVQVYRARATVDGRTS